MREIVMTIEERAKKYATQKADISLSDIYNKALANIYEEAYIAGATEQKAIDINKTCKWLKENIDGGVHPSSTYGFVEKFKKAMNE